MIFEHGFPISEFVKRVDNAQAKIRAASMDALMFMSEREFTYFAGFQSNFWQSLTRPWFLIASAKGKPIVVIPSIVENGLSITWTDDECIWASPNTDDEGINLSSDTLKKLAIMQGRVGMRMGLEIHPRILSNDFSNLRRALGCFDLVDATDILPTLRMLISDREIAKHKYICELVSDAYENFSNIIKLGMSERKVLGAHQLDLLSRGADTVSYFFSTAAEDETDDAICFPSDRPLFSDDVLLPHTGADFDGYYCDLDRNFGSGHASKATKRAYDLECRANDAGIAAERLGVLACDVWKAMADALGAGGAKSGGVGCMVSDCIVLNGYR